MLKREEEFDEDLMDDFDEEDESPKKAKRGKKAPKPAKVKKAPKPKKAKGGFFAGEAFEPYQGKINSIIYFVMSFGCLFLYIPMIFFGSGYAHKAMSYMEESGDTDGIGFIAAGKGIRSLATIIFFIEVIIIALYVTVIAAGLAAIM